MRSFIHPTAHVGPDVEIGDGCYVSAHASIEGTVRIGWGCFIGPGARIGSPGFGYEWVPEPDDPDPRRYWKWKPHDFGVVLGDFVDVGANACIDRGSWRNTVIGGGTKIDNLVHIAHNVVTGRNCCIIAGAEVSGSCELADEVYIAPNACVRERLSLGRHCIVGLGAVVVKDVPAEMIVAGCPATVRGRVTDWPPPPPEGK